MPFGNWQNVLKETAEKFTAKVSHIQDSDEKKLQWQQLDRKFLHEVSSLPTDLRMYKANVYDPARNHLIQAIDNYAEECARVYAFDFKLKLKKAMMTG